MGRYLVGADQETVIHEVFCCLIEDQGVRAGFRGGSLAAWLTTVARNKSIDYLRRKRRENSLDTATIEELSATDAEAIERQIEAHRLVETFKRRHLPEKWTAVFEVRFLEQLSQREAAEKLGINRTTLAYQEHCIRRLLRRYLLQDRD